MAIEPSCAVPHELAVLPAGPARRAGLDAPPPMPRSSAPAPAPAAPTTDQAVWAVLLDGPLAPGVLQVLTDLAQPRLVLPGQSVLARQGAATMLVALRSGEVALGLRTDDGTFRTERIVRGPAWLDLSAAWVDQPYAMDAVAHGAAQVVDLPRAALQDRLAEHPALAQRLIRSLAREVQALASTTHELMHKDAPARLAQWLVERCEPLAGEPGRGIVRLTERKRDVASQLAITPETLSRLMRSFTRQGVIEVTGYTLRVLDTMALARLAKA